MEIVRFTKIAAIISMVFWIVWCTFAPAPNSIGITLGQWIFPKQLPRTMDFVGIITIGITWWYLRRYQEHRNPNSVTKGGDNSLIFLGIVVLLTIVGLSPTAMGATTPRETYIALYVCAYVAIHCMAILPIILGSTIQIHHFCAGISIMMGMIIGYIPTSIWFLIAVLIAVGLKGLLQLILTVWGLHKPERT